MTLDKILLMLECSWDFKQDITTVGIFLGTQEKISLMLECL